MDSARSHCEGKGLAELCPRCLEWLNRINDGACEIFAEGAAGHWELPWILDTRGKVRPMADVPELER